MKKYIFYIFLSILFVVSICLSFFFGKTASPIRTQEVYAEPIVGHTFCAEILSIHEKYIQVYNISDEYADNKILYDVYLNDSIRYVSKMGEITLSDLAVGDRIMVTYDGRILEIFPLGVTDIVQIYLLEN